MAARTKKQFYLAFSDILEESGMSLRQLEKITKRIDNKGNGISHGHIGLLLKKKRAPTPAVIELLSRSLNINPEYFLEWREHIAQQQALRAVDLLDFDTVMDTLDELVKKKYRELKES